jgi:hypothetical protein
MNRETAKKNKIPSTTAFQNGFTPLLHICKSLHARNEPVSVLASTIASKCHENQYRDTKDANDKSVAYYSHCAEVRDLATTALASQFQDDETAARLLKLELEYAKRVELRESVSDHKGLCPSCIFTGGGIPSSENSDLNAGTGKPGAELLYLREQVSAAAILHDTVEDTFMELPTLSYLLTPTPNHIHPYALNLVYQLTNLTEMGKGFEGREVQNAIDYFYYTNLTPLALLIKTADRRHNLESARYAWKHERWVNYLTKTRLFLRATDLLLLDYEEFGSSIGIPSLVRERVKNMIEFNRDEIKKIVGVESDNE